MKIITTNKFSFLLLVTLLASFYNCKSTSKAIHKTVFNDTVPSKPLNETDLKTWWFKDIYTDSIPGISLDKAYNTLLKHKKGKQVTVAVIDMAVDINHEDLHGQIWTNSDEIPNNGIDDDNNGYVDDVNGWNFLGNKNGDNARFVNYEYTRIIKKYETLFSKLTVISSKDSLQYNTYKRAKEKFTDRYKTSFKDTIRINKKYNRKKEAENALLHYFKDGKYSNKDLDSLKNSYPKDTLLGDNIYLVKFYRERPYFNEAYVKNYNYKVQERYKKLLNVNYNDREVMGDNPDDINDPNYGNNIVNYDVAFLSHGTFMAGSIAANRANAIGTQGISNNIKIMPLNVSAYGDEHDKDIALAIRYAVNNGAKVINMSFGKSFSLYSQWVFDAFKYAEKHNVLLVTSAGNSGEKISANSNYPNDVNTDTIEVCDNFLKVGASSFKANASLRNRSSNYSKTQVDVFCPGYKIYTTAPNNTYKVGSGTSSAAAITSGVAALIFSYYPNLTAAQVKHILMDSGIQYNFPVKTPTEDDKDKTTPFNELSKSGKIINAYNALVMAERIASVFRKAKK